MPILEMNRSLLFCTDSLPLRGRASGSWGFLLEGGGGGGGPRLSPISPKMVPPIIMPKKMAVVRAALPPWVSSAAQFAKFGKAAVSNSVDHPLAKPT